MSNSRVILLAEDSSDDTMLIQAAFKRAGFDNPFVLVANGEEAIAYLKGEGQYTNRSEFPIPSLLLLDLKMPRMDGFEVLKWIREHPEWRCLPVIVLTTSYQGSDINRAYDLGANSFLTKPPDFQEYVSAVKQVGQFWLKHNLSPAPGPFVPQSTKSEGSVPKPGNPAVAQRPNPHTTPSPNRKESTPPLQPGSEN